MGIEDGNPPTPQPEQSPGPSAVLDRSLIQRIRRIAVGLKCAHLRLWLAIAELTENTPDHSVTIDLRKLCQIAAIAKSDFPEAIKKIQDDGLITVRHGTSRRANRYTCVFFGSISDPRTDSVGRFSTHTEVVGGSISDPQPDLVGLFPTHEETRGSISDPRSELSPLVSKTRRPLDSDAVSDPNLDRVLNSKTTDSDPATLKFFANWLHSFMGKFGRDPVDDTRYLETKRGVPPPDKEIVARFCAVATPQQLAEFLENLTLDAKAEDARLNPRGPGSDAAPGSFQPLKYAWFVYVALSRIHGIHYTKTHRAQDALRVHKRSGVRIPAAQNTPQPAEQPGLDFAAEINQLAKVKGMK